MENIIKNDFADELRIEGINCKGYGILPKYIMYDTDLTLEAKSIYAYFCSYAGAGSTAFPSRDKILADLPLCKDAYYKHFGLLTKQGYITVEQSISSDNLFAKNIYTLVSSPKKFDMQPAKEQQTEPYDIIRLSGLKAYGYGMIPKAVMLDSRLSLKAKGIYAYFCCLTGAGNVAFPRKSRIMYHLNISHNAYQRYYKELISYNYMSAAQRHIKGRLSVNDYYLIENPNIASAAEEAMAVQCTQKQDTGKQYTQKQDTGKQDTQIQDTQIQDTQIQDTNINNLNSNSNISNNLSINHEDGQTDETFSLGVEKDEVEELIKANVDYYRFADDDGSALRRIYEKCINLMTEACCAAQPYIRISGTDMPTATVRQRFFEITSEQLDHMIEIVSMQSSKIKNWKNYLLAALYAVPVLSDIENDFAIFRDFEARPQPPQKLQENDYYL